MLDSKFCEGNELATTSFVEIALPGDAAWPMSILLNILHQRNSSVPYELRDAKMIDVLNPLKKYMCMESVKLAGRL